MQNGQNDMVRVAAACALLDRGWGKPGQAHTGDKGEGDIKVVIRHITRDNVVEERPLQIDAMPNETYETDGEGRRPDQLYPSFKRERMR